MGFVRGFAWNIGECDGFWVMNWRWMSDISNAGAVLGNGIAFQLLFVIVEFVLLIVSTSFLTVRLVVHLSIFH